MKYRESGTGSFTREVGDFIAHAKRDRGATLDTTAYMFAQLAFYQTYNLMKQTLNPKGKCGWWLRHYLLMKTKYATEQEIVKASGLTKKQAKNAIKSWFTDKQIYPIEIHCNDSKTLFALAGHFSQRIEAKNVFDMAQATHELEKIFSAENIDHREITRFIVGTAVLLNGKSVEIVQGLTATVSLTLGTARHIPVEHEDNTETLQYAKPLPDGNITIGVDTDNKTGDGLVGIYQYFLETGIDTESYFSRSLVEFDPNGFPSLRLKGPFSFDTSHNFPVNEIK
ncbi:MAG: hypothetical protein E5V25_06310 [Mesorhizobium sp.]|nr:MAG: hypothetical protein E5V25_06310 [Mesorhizobium sp.]